MLDVFSHIFYYYIKTIFCSILCMLLAFLNVHAIIFSASFLACTEVSDNS